MSDVAGVSMVRTIRLAAHVTAGGTSMTTVCMSAAPALCLPTHWTVHQSMGDVMYTQRCFFGLISPCGKDFKVHTDFAIFDRELGLRSEPAPWRTAVAPTLGFEGVDPIIHC